MKNKKISKSLKRHYRKKRIIYRTKLISLMTFLSLAWFLTGAVQATAPYEFMNNRLPESGDRELNIYEKRQIVANKIRAISKERSFKWENYAVNIACEESLLGTDMQNAIGNYPADSIDRGYYGINSFWHAEISDKCSYSLECSTNFFMDMVEAGRQHEWVSDRKVRGKPNYSLIKCGVN